MYKVIEKIEKFLSNIEIDNYVCEGGCVHNTNTNYAGYTTEVSVSGDFIITSDTSYMTEKLSKVVKGCLDSLKLEQFNDVNNTNYDNISDIANLSLRVDYDSQENSVNIKVSLYNSEVGSTTVHEDKFNFTSMNGLKKQLRKKLNYIIKNLDFEYKNKRS